MRYDDPNAPISATVAVISAVVVLVSILLLEALYYKMEEREFRTKVVEPKNIALEEMHRDQEQVLESYGWIDEEQQVVRIPIDRAMELVIEESAAGGNDG